MKGEGRRAKSLPNIEQVKFVQLNYLMKPIVRNIICYSCTRNVFQTLLKHISNVNLQFFSMFWIIISFWLKACNAEQISYELAASPRDLS